MSEPELTERQREILKFICQQIERDGAPPTVREIGDQFGIASSNGVFGHLRALERKGLIERSGQRARGIRLSSEFKQQHRGLPLAGQVSAGALLEAIEQTQRIEFDPWFERPGTYVLQVNGDSMIDAHICDGDYVVVRPASTADRGEIVVVRTADGEATVKYFYPEKNRIRLQPANRKLKPMYVRQAEIMGVVIGVVRTLQ